MTATYIALSTTTIGASTATVTFSSIPATYRDLVVVISGTATGNAPSSKVTFNSDNGNNYNEVAMYGLGSSAASFSTPNIAFNQGLFLQTTQGQYILQILDYAQTNKHKTLLSRTDTASYAVFAMAGRYASTNAINTIKLELNGGPSFAAGCTFSLYGIN